MSAAALAAPTSAGGGTATIPDLDVEDDACFFPFAMPLEREVGQGPPLAEGIRAEIGFAGLRGIRAWALSPMGDRKQEVPGVETEDRLLIRTGPECRTLWYEIGAE